VQLLTCDELGCNHHSHERDPLLIRLMTICEVCVCVDYLELTYPLTNWQQQVQVKQLGPFDKSYLDQ
jgi:hypothetical protein